MAERWDCTLREGMDNSYKLAVGARSVSFEVKHDRCVKLTNHCSLVSEVCIEHWGG
jgi:hypothetical protein